MTEPAYVTGHPLRRALWGLFAEVDALTSTEAARRLGTSTGACSFHLRQLARHGYLEPLPDVGGRTRPWRRVTGPVATAPAGTGTAHAATGTAHTGTGTTHAGAGTDLSGLARELEDEGYRRWRVHRETAPDDPRRDEAFSEVLYLTPGEVEVLATALRATVAALRQRKTADPRRGGTGGIGPVGFVARLFPLLPAGADEQPHHPGGSAPGPGSAGRS